MHLTRKGGAQGNTAFRVKLTHIKAIVHILDQTRSDRATRLAHFRFWNPENPIKCLDPESRENWEHPLRLMNGITGLDARINIRENEEWSDIHWQLASA